MKGSRAFTKAAEGLETGLNLRGLKGFEGEGFGLGLGRGLTGA